MTRDDLAVLHLLARIDVRRGQERRRFEDEAADRIYGEAYERVELEWKAVTDR